MNTKLVPAMLALAAAAISCVFSIIQKVSFSVFTMRLLCSSVIFLVFGTILKMFVDYAFKTKDNDPNAITDFSEDGLELENIDSQDKKLSEND